MPLSYQVAPVTFTKGLDTHTQRKLMVPGKWDELVNVSLSADGSLRRRDGFEALVGGQDGNWLATRDRELLVIDGPSLSTVSASGGAPRALEQASGQLPYVDVSTSEVIQNSANHDQQDMAYGEGYAVYVWRNYAAGNGTATGIQCTLVDIESGAKLICGQSVAVTATATSPRVVYADGIFYIFHVDTPTLVCTTIDATAPTVLGSATTVVLDANLVNDNFDACDFGSEAIVVVPYNDGVTSVRAYAVTGTTPAVTAGPLNVVAQASVTYASIRSIAVRGYNSATLIGVFLQHSAGGALGAGLVGAVVDDTAFTVSTAATLLDGTAAPAVASPCHCTATPVGSGMQVFSDQQSSYLSANLRPLRSGIWSTTLTSSTAAYTVINSACFQVNAAQASGPQGPFIAGKAFTSDGVAFLPVAMLENYFTLSLGANCRTLNEQNAFYLLRCPSAAPLSTVVAGALYQRLGLMDVTLGGNAPTVGTPCSSPAIDDGFGLCVQEHGDLQITNGFNTTPVGLTHLTLTPRTSAPGVDTQLAESTYFTGGQLSQYDGQQILPVGLPMFPEGISAVVSAPGGGTKLTIGVHQVVAVYEWVDAGGNRHQSAPSLPVSVTVANPTDQINVLIPTTQLIQTDSLGGAISPVHIVCYMTAAGGLQFYRAIASYTPVPNTTLASTVAYTIGAVVMTDDRLTSNELLYTQPNQAGTTLPNMAPGPMHGIGVSQRRLWGFQSDRPLEFTYSQESLPSTGLQFNPDTLGGILPAESGGGIAIAALDEKTVLFGARKLYVVYGNGPTPSGGFNGFSEPQEIPSDVGCSDARSVLSMPQGLMFKSPKGWYLLGRDLTVKYIGDGVARWDEYDVTSAVLLEDRQECRFGSNEGPTLVYSYEQDAWSVYYMGSVLQPGGNLSAVWWSATERYVHLQPDSGTFPGLMQDTPGAYVDGLNTATPLQALIYARTGWLHVSALEGFQRVRRMYLTATGADDTLPDTDLVIAVDFDDLYDSDAPGSYVFSVSLGTAFAGTDPECIDLRHRLAHQKCKSVAFSFLEGGGEDYGANPIGGLQVSSLEVGVKSGVNRLPAARTVG